MKKIVTTDGRVNYSALREAHLPSLNEYIEAIGLHAIDNYPRNQQLATLINLYNAVVLKAVADRYQPGYSVSEDDFAIFNEPLVRLGDKTISLNDLEHEIIRKEFTDPRVHVALVCAAESCPPLLARAYRADDLDQILEENMRRFVNDPVRNPIDHEKKQAKLSKIFEWYADDFGGKDKLIEYLNRYSDTDLTGYDVSFVEYSWELNEAK